MHNQNGTATATDRANDAQAQAARKKSRNSEITREVRRALCVLAAVEAFMYHYESSVLFGFVNELRERLALQ